MDHGLACMDFVVSVVSVSNFPYLDFYMFSISHQTLNYFFELQNRRRQKSKKRDDAALPKVKYDISLESIINCR